MRHFARELTTLAGRYTSLSQGNSQLKEPRRARLLKGQISTAGLLSQGLISTSRLKLLRESES